MPVMIRQARKGRKRTWIWAAISVSAAGRSAREALHDLVGDIVEQLEIIVHSPRSAHLDRKRDDLDPGLLGQTVGGSVLHVGTGQDDRNVAPLEAFGELLQVLRGRLDSRLRLNVIHHV